MIETVQISEMLDFSSELTWLIAWGDFGTCVHSDSFKSYMM
jgi:hypothetical protein